MLEEIGQPPFYLLQTLVLPWFTPEFRRTLGGASSSPVYPYISAEMFGALPCLVVSNNRPYSSVAVDAIKILQGTRSGA